MSTAARPELIPEPATHATGPVTPAGKTISSRNAITFGLFAVANAVLPGEESEHAAFAAAYLEDLDPQGQIEQTLAAEIVSAASRLRRCGLAESALALNAAADPLLNPESAPVLASIERARSTAHRNFHRALNELRRLQTNTAAQSQIDPHGPDTGLVSYRELVAAGLAHTRYGLAQRKLNDLGTIEQIIESTLPPTMRSGTGVPAASGQVRFANLPSE